MVEGVTGAGQGRGGDRRSGGGDRSGPSRGEGPQRDGRGDRSGPSRGEGPQRGGGVQIDRGTRSDRPEPSRNNQAGPQGNYRDIQRQQAEKMQQERSKMQERRQAEGQAQQDRVRTQPQNRDDWQRQQAERRALQDRIRTQQQDQQNSGRDRRPDNRDLDNNRRDGLQRQGQRRNDGNNNLPRNDDRREQERIKEFRNEGRRENYNGREYSRWGSDKRDYVSHLGDRGRQFHGRYNKFLFDGNRYYGGNDYDQRWHPINVGYCRNRHGGYVPYFVDSSFLYDPYNRIGYCDGPQGLIEIEIFVGPNGYYYYYDQYGRQVRIINIQVLGGGDYRQLPYNNPYNPYNRYDRRRRGSVTIAP